MPAYFFLIVPYAPATWQLGILDSSDCGLGRLAFFFRPAGLLVTWLLLPLYRQLEDNQPKMKMNSKLHLNPT
jgi:hypothetical protein